MYAQMLSYSMFSGSFFSLKYLLITYRDALVKSRLFKAWQYLDIGLVVVSSDYISNMTCTFSGN